MILGFIFQLTDGSFRQVHLMAAFSIYITEAEQIIEKMKSGEVVCGWKVVRKAILKQII